ncbi:titin homolog isoform X2 [Neocloeon triangulifer]|uniref:titin homolog isoform X2 n=1 Tax=Neocloeon triangulifer TaxID=2078957 RepID=UPI00286F2E64|nr:titin homolog isoform X2 [Neocloeon triangulifer]
MERGNTTPTKKRKPAPPVSPAARVLTSRALNKNKNSPRKSPRKVPPKTSKPLNESDDSDASTLSEEKLMEYLGRQSWKGNLRPSGVAPQYQQASEPNEDSNSDVHSRPSTSKESTKSTKRIYLPSMSPDKRRNSKDGQNVTDKAENHDSSWQQHKNSLEAFQKGGAVRHSDSEDSEPDLFQRTKVHQSPKRTDDTRFEELLSAEAPKSSVNAPPEVESDPESPINVQRKKNKKSVRGNETRNIDLQLDMTRYTESRNSIVDPSVDSEADSPVKARKPRYKKSMRGNESRLVDLQLDASKMSPRASSAALMEDSDSDGIDIDKLRRPKIKKSLRPNETRHLDLQLESSNTSKAATSEETSDEENIPSRNTKSRKSKKSVAQTLDVSFTSLNSDNQPAEERESDEDIENIPHRQSKLVKEKSTLNVELPQMTPEKTVPVEPIASDTEESPEQLRRSMMSGREKMATSQSMLLSPAVLDSPRNQIESDDSRHDSPVKTFRSSFRPTFRALTPIEMPILDESNNQDSQGQTQSENDDSIDVSKRPQQRKSCSSERELDLPPPILDQDWEEIADPGMDPLDVLIQDALEKMSPKSSNGMDLPQQENQGEMVMEDSVDETVDIVRKKTQSKLSSKSFLEIYLPPLSHPDAEQEQLQNENSVDQSIQNSNNVHQQEQFEKDPLEIELNQLRSQDADVRSIDSENESREEIQLSRPKTRPFEKQQTDFSLPPVPVSPKSTSAKESNQLEDSNGEEWVPTRKNPSRSTSSLSNSSTNLEVQEKQTSMRTDFSTKESVSSAVVEDENVSTSNRGGASTEESEDDVIETRRQRAAKKISRDLMFSLSPLKSIEDGKSNVAESGGKPVDASERRSRASKASVAMQITLDGNIADLDAPQPNALVSEKEDISDVLPLDETVEPPQEIEVENTSNVSAKSTVVDKSQAGNATSISVSAPLEASVLSDESIVQNRRPNLRDKAKRKTSSRFEGFQLFTPNREQTSLLEEDNSGEPIEPRRKARSLKSLPKKSSSSVSILPSAEEVETSNLNKVPEKQATERSKSSTGESVSSAIVEEENVLMSHRDEADIEESEEEVVLSRKLRTAKKSSRDMAISLSPLKSMLEGKSNVSESSEKPADAKKKRSREQNSAPPIGEDSEGETIEPRRQNKSEGRSPQKSPRSSSTKKVETSNLDKVHEKKTSRKTKSSTRPRVSFASTVVDEENISRTSKDGARTEESEEEVIQPQRPRVAKKSSRVMEFSLSPLKSMSDGESNLSESGGKSADAKKKRSREQNSAPTNETIEPMRQNKSKRRSPQESPRSSLKKRVETSNLEKTQEEPSSRGTKSSARASVASAVVEEENLSRSNRDEASTEESEEEVIPSRRQRTAKKSSRDMAISLSPLKSMSEGKSNVSESSEKPAHAKKKRSGEQNSAPPIGEDSDGETIEPRRQNKSKEHSPQKSPRSSSIKEVKTSNLDKVQEKKTSRKTKSSTRVSFASTVVDEENISKTSMGGARTEESEEEVIQPRRQRAAKKSSRVMEFSLSPLRSISGGKSNVSESGGKSANTTEKRSREQKSAPITEEDNVGETIVPGSQERSKGRSQISTHSSSKLTLIEEFAALIADSEKPQETGTMNSPSKNTRSVKSKQVSLAAQKSSSTSASSTSAVTEISEVDKNRTESQASHKLSAKKSEEPKNKKSKISIRVGQKGAEKRPAKDSDNFRLSNTMDLDYSMMHEESYREPVAPRKSVKEVTNMSLESTKSRHHTLANEEAETSTTVQRNPASESDSSSEEETPVDFKRRKIQYRKSKSWSNSTAGSLKFSFRAGNNTTASSIKSGKEQEKTEELSKTSASKKSTPISTGNESNAQESSAAEGISILDEQMQRYTMFKYTGEASISDILGPVDKIRKQTNIGSQDSAESLVTHRHSPAKPSKVDNAPVPQLVEKATSSNLPKKTGSNVTSFFARQKSSKQNLQKSLGEEGDSNATSSSFALNDKELRTSTPQNDMVLTEKDVAEALEVMENNPDVSDDTGGDKIYTREDFSSVLGIFKQPRQSYRGPKSKKVFTLADFEKAMYGVRSPSMLVDMSSAAHLEGLRNKFSIRDFERAVIKLKNKSIAGGASVSTIQTPVPEKAKGVSNVVEPNEISSTPLQRKADQREEPANVTNAQNNEKRAFSPVIDTPEVNTQPQSDSLNQEDSQTVLGTPEEEDNYGDNEDNDEDNNDSGENQEEESRRSSPDKSIEQSVTMNPSDSSNESDRNQNTPDPETETQSYSEKTVSSDSPESSDEEAELQKKDEEKSLSPQPSTSKGPPAKEPSKRSTQGQSLITSFLGNSGRSSKSVAGPSGQGPSNSARRTLLTVDQNSPSTKRTKQTGVNESGVGPIDGKESIRNFCKNYKEFARQKWNQFGPTVMAKAQEEARKKQTIIPKAKPTARKPRIAAPVSAATAAALAKQVDILKEMKKEGWVNKRLLLKLDKIFKDQPPKVRNDFIRYLATNIREVLKKKAVDEKRVRNVMKACHKVGICHTYNEFGSFMRDYLPTLFEEKAFLKFRFEKIYYDFGENNQ